ncbi:MAG: FAD-dependent monooxygenase [Betaproteobacteria bacterium]|nr:MAG: FAD-dependent monooxygenase [Betaproteobacteria bacterium]
MESEVVIVGGGLVGGSLAAALADAGVPVTLVDAGTAPPSAVSQPAGTEFDRRVFAIRPAGRQFLERCGIWRHIDESRVAPVTRMVVTGDDGVSRLNFDAYRSGIAELAVIVENTALQAAVKQALGERILVNRLDGRRCEALGWSDAAVRVCLDDGEQIDVQLVVGADGANSRVRELAGIPISESAYGHSAVVANFETTVGHDGTAWQWFRRDGVLALLPLPGKRVSMVWSTQQSNADELIALEIGELAERVSEASNAVLGELVATTSAAAFPLRLMKAASITGTRLALVGDAAHNVHPLAGQGLNLGLADASSLASAIDARGPDEIGSSAVLARYRRSRAEEIMAMQLTTDGLHRLFQSSAPGVAWLRNTGLRLTERLSPLKRVLVKHATG